MRRKFTLTLHYTTYQTHDEVKVHLFLCQHLQSRGIVSVKAGGKAKEQGWTTKQALELQNVFCI